MCCLKKHRPIVTLFVHWGQAVGGLLGCGLKLKMSQRRVWFHKNTHCRLHACIWIRRSTFRGSFCKQLQPFPTWDRKGFCVYSKKQLVVYGFVLESATAWGWLLFLLLVGSLVCNVAECVCVSVCVCVCVVCLCYILCLNSPVMDLMTLPNKKPDWLRDVLGPLSLSSQPHFSGGRAAATASATAHRGFSSLFFSSSSPFSPPSSLCKKELLTLIERSSLNSCVRPLLSQRILLFKIRYYRWAPIVLRERPFVYRLRELQINISESASGFDSKWKTLETWLYTSSILNQYFQVISKITTSSAVPSPQSFFEHLFGHCFVFFLSTLLFCLQVKPPLCTACLPPICLTTRWWTKLSVLVAKEPDFPPRT